MNRCEQTHTEQHPSEGLPSFPFTFSGVRNQGFHPRSLTVFFYFYCNRSQHDYFPPNHVPRGSSCWCKREETSKKSDYENNKTGEAQKVKKKKDDIERGCDRPLSHKRTPTRVSLLSN
ncbi:hypothetical protein, unlikely [Trypanosoma brucei gambiense DAL972]|uniref:Uncharacterized protein n=1 Tax=Trypanosoma brucei gambiense (strain MHOM/CI/86/DAL972) TaxID=679716 RepID=D0A1M1_TRYB9|nr:hypothetical protein, unlikely [Trypanosoma brucei gambiense DAL972]CBH15163.1 hypothetical protein, unlikely [Trypanosoma brucei gambiense DAL972]|eukprot:XP_011777429.1 hypothetical protein, unlikely [Trypanosoma brucei gambiense DAL972]